MAAPTDTLAPGSLDDDVDYLLDLDDVEFIQFITNNVNPAAPSRVWDALLDDDLVIRTRRALGSKHQDMLQQIATRSAANDNEFDPTYREWRSRIDLLMRFFAKRINEAKQACRDRHERVTAQLTTRLRGTVRQLAVAVYEHRNAVVAAGLAPEPHDLALWDLLDEIELPADTDDPKTLAALLVSGVWHAQEGGA